MTEAGAGGNRPLITYGLITYKQADFVREAIRSALAQTYRPLEIVICDDASPDATLEIAQAELSNYRGPHTVRLCRNPRNLGIGNFNNLMSRAKGELVVIAHGDDVSHPDRVSLIVAAWQRTGASMVTSNCMKIDASGKNLGLFLAPGTVAANQLLDIAANGWNRTLLGAVLAWDRRVFDVFGPLDPDRSAITSDFILPFRAALLNGIHYLDVPLVKVRQHPGQKQRVYINDTEDRLANRESQSASHLIQNLYMLETLDTAAVADLCTDEDIAQARVLITRAILSHARRWRLARNRLNASGKRVRWVPVEN